MAAPARSSHDWSAGVDRQHLAEVRARPDEFAPGGTVHLLLEVLAYVDDEAAETGRGGCSIVLHRDGSVSVADSGRGTETVIDTTGQPLRKPVVSTRDLRFFDLAPPVLLPDGAARRGLSVVAALSRRLVHTNRRPTGSWQQEFVHGMPVSDLQPLLGAGADTGTTIRFLPDPGLAALSSDPAEVLAAVDLWPRLTIELRVG